MYETCMKCMKMYDFSIVENTEKQPNGPIFFFYLEYSKYIVVTFLENIKYDVPSKNKFKDIPGN